MTVSKYRSSGQKVKSVPIIHCTTFAYTDPVAKVAVAASGEGVSEIGNASVIFKSGL